MRIRRSVRRGASGVSAQEACRVKVSLTDWVEGVEAGTSRKNHRIRQELKSPRRRLERTRSNGAYRRAEHPARPGYRCLRETSGSGVGITTIAVGLITKRKQAEDIIASGRRHVSRWRAPCFTTAPGAGQAPRTRRPVDARRNTALAALDPKGVVRRDALGDEVRG